MIAVDTNLLVYAHRAHTPEHAAAKAALEGAAADRRGWGIALPSIAELWMVATHPSSSGRPSTPAEDRDFLEALQRTAGLRVFQPGRTLGVRLARLAADLDVSGPRIFDLQIGLVALDGGATEIWTHDARFAAPPGLRVHDPLA